MLSRTPSPTEPGEIVGDDDFEGPVDVPEDVIFSVIENSDLVLLLRWRRTSKVFFAAVAIELRARYKLSIHPFIENTALFDNALRAHGAVVSGSVALQYFLPSCRWDAGDMDIYVPDHTFDDFITDLVAPDGLNFSHVIEVPGRPRISSIQQGMSLVKDLRRYITPTRRYVDVIRSPHRSPITPIQGFWSTLVMNFLTPDGAACGFPEATMASRAFVKAGYLTRGDERAITKYAQRGFTILDDEWWGDTPEYDPGMLRYFGERRGLVFDFRTAVDSRQPLFPITPTRQGWYILRPFPSAPINESEDT